MGVHPHQRTFLMSLICQRWIEQRSVPILIISKCRLRQLTCVQFFTWKWRCRSSMQLSNSNSFVLWYTCGQFCDGYSTQACFTNAKQLQLYFAKHSWRGGMSFLSCRKAHSIFITITLASKCSIYILISRFKLTYSIEMSTFPLLYILNSNSITSYISPNSSTMLIPTDLMFPFPFLALHNICFDMGC